MKTRAILLLNALLLLSSCSESASDPNAGVGTISGTVRVMDLPEATELSDRSGITVTVDGTTHSATSDADGSWRIDGLAAGIYNIVFTKEGLDTTRILRYRALGVGHYIFDTTTVARLPEASAELRFGRVEIANPGQVAITVAGVCSGKDVANGGVLLVTDLNGKRIAERQVAADSTTGSNWGNFRMYCLATTKRPVQKGEAVRVTLIPYWSVAYRVSPTESVTKEFYGKGAPMNATIE